MLIQTFHRVTKVVFRYSRRMLLLGVCVAQWSCGRAQPTVEEVALEEKIGPYRNGWFHWASGNQTIEEIAQYYHRDPALVADLNKSKIATTPSAGSAIYVPPSGDREQLRDTLIRLRESPGSVPTTPPTPEILAMLSGVAPIAAAPVAAEPVRDAEPPPAQPAPAQPPPVQAAPAQPPPIQASPVQPAPAATSQAIESASPVNATVSQPPPPAQPIPAAAPVPVQPTMVSVTSAGGGASVSAAPNPSILATASPMSSGGNIVMISKNAASTSFAWPVRGKIVQEYVSTMEAKFRGIIIEAQEGTAIAASQKGHVVFAGELTGYGQVVIVNHDGGFATVYGYCSQLYVRAHDEVALGQQIALVGRPVANSPGQLFFQIRKRGEAVNPKLYLP